MTFKEFIERHRGLSLDARRIGQRSAGGDDWDSGARHYSVTLSGGMERGWIDFEYSQGSAWTTAPDLADVLQSIQGDASCAEGELFEEFCSNFGYDSDSRKVERTWKACVQMRGELVEFFAEYFDEFMSLEES